MSEDFEINEPVSTFDFRGFLFRLLRYWPLFLISLAIAFGIAYYINVRKLPIYQMENMVSIKDDQNPFFTSNTSLTFNWGGTTDKVNTAIITLKSRSHNEKVVERLQYYVDYLKDGEYQQVDAYKQTPFFVEIDTTKPQIQGKQLQVVFRDSVNFTLSATFTEGAVPLFNYASKEKTSVFVEAGEFSKQYKMGQKINLPFFSGTFMPNPDFMGNPGTPYYIVLKNYDGTVRQYLGIRVDPESKGSSVLRMRLTGNNKAKLVDYLNTSVEVLSQDMLDRKNLFATKTIRFIDSSLAMKSAELSTVEDELNQFKNKNAIFNLESEGSEINTKLSELDLRKEAVNRELNYYNTLQNYLTSRSDYRDVPAPSVAGISESSIVSGVGRIIQLSEERNKLRYSFKDGAPVFADIDRQIDAVKNVLLENIRSSKSLKTDDLNAINRDIGRYESEIRGLPKEQQDLLKIERRYNLSQGSYNLFLSKRSEAGLVKAANVSDVMVIDSAKDTGGGQVGPNTKLNYMMALLFGSLIPFLFVFVRVFFDTKIGSVKELERITSIPLLGVIGKSHIDSNLAVITKPKSAIAESFRALRSSLQFIYRKQGIEGAKTVLITSSVSGEGKTFCSINIASVFALSEKRTVLVGLDLRKPKIFDDFGIDNAVGVVNYLINDASLEQIIQKTEVDYLDVITAGPIPPNPSELLMGERMELLIDSLKEEYDYIILDSPPMGLVADSLELTKLADATIYLVRHNYTQKNMFTFVNEKYKTGEVKHISLVLNDYQEKAGKGYGYGYGNGYGYGYGSYGNGYHEHVPAKTLLQKIKSNFRK
ncbi:polysaccharide biosynthesis tyrosine autokinase [Aequorivita echinoideorum]|uniref:non-specific protein-tyrosine kinase n=1 Tax=Aequorivita echinoideorum TaxID=1549647 RepID=A0ABS5S6Y9_9FLAO|nr:tyrosine-protein kinase [Aequorivita echinoideorum]MBT0608971.1 polysaccharide biosynthesis tyrosine autokinase [Aequorivita echinoideorum]